MRGSRKAHGAGLHGNDVVRIIGGEIDVVDHQDYRAALLVAQAAQRAHDLHGVLHVEIVERLVEQQNVRLLGDRHGQEGHLALAAAQLIDVGKAQIVQRQKGDGRVDRLPVLRRQVTPAVGKAAEGDQLFHRQAQMKIGRLAQGGHQSRIVLDFDGRDAAPVYRNLAAIRLLQARDEHQQGGLAGAIRADQGRHFPLGKLHADVVQHAPGAVAFFNMVDVNHAVPRVRTMSARKYAPHTRLTRMPTVVR
ncbi:hypothetical protein D3C72_945780 [compost metagenome]